jgi:hypothetical protein
MDRIDVLDTTKFRLNENLVQDEDKGQELDQKYYDQQLNNLIVTDVSAEIFVDDQKKFEFERLFTCYETTATIAYFRALRRCRVTYVDEINAIQAQLDLNNYQLVDNQQIRVYFAQVIQKKNIDISFYN